jgi:hypothetical protein
VRGKVRTKWKKWQGQDKSKSRGREQGSEWAARSKERANVEVNRKRSGSERAQKQRDGKQMASD